jgi:hypothetical protein
MMSSHSDSFVASGSSPTEPDFVVEDHGTIFLLTPRTEPARNWTDQFIGQDNGFQPYWPTVVIEHRYVAEILEGIRNQGLVAVPR